MRAGVNHAHETNGTYDLLYINNFFSRNGLKKKQPTAHLYRRYFTRDIPRALICTNVRLLRVILLKTKLKYTLRFTPSYIKS